MVKRFIKDIIYSPETIKITLFYSENLKDFQISEIKESPALLSQGRAKFFGADKEISLPLQQKWGVPQQREFVSVDDGGGYLKKSEPILLTGEGHGRAKTDLPSARLAESGSEKANRQRT